MAKEAKTPVPVDRPMSRAYLREFSGWSTAYPPGLSDPTSLRKMENVYITREGACRIRPGIHSVFTENWWLGNAGEKIVGSFEHFVFDNTGKIALLFAVRGGAGTLSFRVVTYNQTTKRFDDAPGVFPAMTFGAGTTYVRYLQIDNKIIALSNDAAEPAIIFNVGAIKSAKKVPSAGLTIPEFTEVPLVVHPDAAWIDTVAKATRPTAETPTPGTLVSSLPTVGTGSVVSGVFRVTGHGLAVGQAVSFTGTTAPSGFTFGQIYYVKSVVNKDDFTLTATLGGTVIAPSGGSADLLFTLGPDATGAQAESPNTYTFAYFYTFETEFGESKPSGIALIKTQRGWSQWKFNSPDANGNEETTLVVDSKLAMDQLVAMLPVGQYDAAKSQGATKWNLYQFTWNETSPVPSVAVLVGSRKITAAGTEATESWIINTAAAIADSYIVPVPNEENRVNYSGGPLARQGLAAGDRLVLVNDGLNQALIRWSSNVPEQYTNFSPGKSGGTKTLSSGNLLVPLSVHLWQNPQSTDTIVILCKGLNGYHAAYYMAPASVSGQSDSTLIMGFEETTATPGTVSPYGNEVYNNALYHTLEAELMKSTAANYTISHKTMTTDVANKWQALLNKENIISSQHDGRLYYIVNNPDGEELEEGCMGNEVWVLDVGSEKPSWSRWLVQGISLRKLQIGDKLHMAIVRPDAIFIFDESFYADEYAVGAGTQRRNIPWAIETNTMGANRSHDAWAHVHKAQVHVGDWLGEFEWGVRGQNVHGFPIQNRLKARKLSLAPQDNDGVSLASGRVSGGVDLGDATDDLLLGEEIMEWRFFANSVERDNATVMSYGQIDFVQFMLMPASMNIGYEEGAIQTFEYGRNVANGNNDVTRNGIAMPRDTTRP